MTGRRVLVLGATGMLGHMVCRVLTAAEGLDPWATVRSGDAMAAGLPQEVIDPKHLLGDLDATAPRTAVTSRLDEIFGTVEPAVVVNCVGLVKQRPDAEDDAQAMAINAELPHVVADRLPAGSRLVHISTDCVFDGTRPGAPFSESDPPNATDLYGRSKAAGEPSGPGVTVLRTSIIGRQLAGTTGLLEWFLAAAEPVEGHRRARFSGVTTPVLAALLAELARHDPPPGLHHVAAEPIDKASLLELLVEHYRPGIDVVPVDLPIIDRCLDGQAFSARTGFVAPTWPDMIAALAADPFPYDRWRSR